MAKRWLSLSSFCGKKPVKFLLSALGCWLFLVLFRSKGSQVVEIVIDEPVIARKHHLSTNFWSCASYNLSASSSALVSEHWVQELCCGFICQGQTLVDSQWLCEFWLVIPFYNDLLLLQKKLLWWGVTFHLTVGVPVRVEDVVRNDSGLERWP